jgi:hypothetical protein
VSKLQARIIRMQEEIVSERKAYNLSIKKVQSERDALSYEVRIQDRNCLCIKKARVGKRHGLEKGTGWKKARVGKRHGLGKGTGWEGRDFHRGRRL